MLKRKVWKKLEEWKKQKRRTALALIGARQVGKSTIAREFGKANYRQVIEINFINEPAAAQIFEERNAKDILIALSAFTQQEIIKGDTLILLDEIQECPNARTAIKFLVEEGSCSYIETGSLLGVNFKEVTSYPVGFEEIVPMFPLDFEEFLWGLDMPQKVIDQLRTYYENESSVPESLHNTFTSLFLSYLVIGGMPAVVQSYADNKNLIEVNRIQKNILDLYRLDISKYAPDGDKNKIRNVFDSIPSELDSKNNRFKMSSLGKNARVSRYENTFMWLEEAGVGLACFNTSSPTAPLEQNAKRSLFKLYFCDTGLLCAFFGQTIQFELIQGNAGINSGSILENVFAQSLRSKDFPLFYYDSKKIGELDFLIQNGQKIDLFEIKSGNNYRTHRAMNNALACREWTFGKKIIFCKGNVEKDGEILYLPWYMIMFYTKNEPESLIWNVDISSLLE